MSQRLDGQRLDIVEGGDNASDTRTKVGGVKNRVIRGVSALRFTSYLPIVLRSRTNIDYRSRTLPRLPGNPALVRLFAAGRILLFPRVFSSIFSLRFFRDYVDGNKDSYGFFFLTHNYYLSKYFTLRERVDCAISHYRHEQRHCGSTYHQSVYHSQGGLILWQREVNGTSYSLILQATDDYRFEGDLSILCLVDGARVCRISFTYVRGALFGLDSDVTMFVTRNQLDRRPELQRFRQDFKQNSPPYFCLAALSGIAMAHGISSICMIKETAQVAYDRRYAESFKNSYSAFWKTFGAEEIAGRHAYKMSLPLKLKLIESVKHKSRAVARRQNWLDIMVNARQTIISDRVTVSPIPLDIEATSYLPMVKAAEACSIGQVKDGFTPAGEPSL